MLINKSEKLKTRDSLISMQLPSIGDPLSNIFNTESMVFSWRSTTFRSSVLSSFSWFKTWSIWRWTWSSISTWISATKQIARVTENIADENCEGWKTWGVFDFSMNRWTLRKRVLIKTSMIFSSFAAGVTVALSGYDSGNVLWVSDLISSIWPGLLWQHWLFSKQLKIHLSVSLTIFK